MSRFMIYGAYGYTGELCAREAVSRHLSPILAGRRVSRLVPLAEELGLEHRAFGLDDVDALGAQLDGVSAVLHCAGPYSATSRPMLEACMAQGVHYLDITGEIAVFEAIFARRPELERAGIVAVPGVGFDVVPTDCMAAMLAEALPHATSLELGFVGLGGVSPGTARTAVEGLSKGRRRPDPGSHQAGAPGLEGPHAGAGRQAAHLRQHPWGDVSMAYHSTGIGDITTYMAVPRGQIAWMKRLGAVRGLLGLPPVQAVLKRVVDANVVGPDETERGTGSSHVWGRVEAPGGRWVEGTLHTPEGYAFTARSAVEAAVRVADGQLKPGPKTPSMAFGAGFVGEIDGVTLDPLVRG